MEFAGGKLCLNKAVGQKKSRKKNPSKFVSLPGNLMVRPYSFSKIFLVLLCARHCVLSPGDNMLNQTSIEGDKLEELLFSAFSRRPAWS